MANEQGDYSGPENQATAEQPSGTLRIVDEAGKVHFLHPHQLTRVTRGAESAAESKILPAEKPAKIEKPEPISEEPLTKEEKIINDCRIIADQVIMHHFPVEEIVKMNAEGKTAEEIDKKFVEAARKYLENITIHRAGITNVRNPNTGEYYPPLDRGDLDGNSAVGLLRMAGVRVKVKFVNAGEYNKGDVNADTGGKPGQAIGAEGENIKYDIYNPVPDRLTLFLDHHGKDAPRDKCTTKQAYEKLTRLGLLKESDALNSAVELVNENDNGYQPVDKYQDSWQTIRGLCDSMRFEDIVDYFESGGTLEAPLTKEQLRQYELVDPDRNLNVPKQLRQSIQGNERTLEYMKRNGLIVRSEKYGMVGIGGVRWEGRGDGIEVLVNWRNRNEDSLTVSSIYDFDSETINYFEENGIPVVKKNMVVKNPKMIPGPIYFSLGELLVDGLGVPDSEIRKSKRLLEEVRADQERVEKLRQRK